MKPMLYEKLALDRERADQAVLKEEQRDRELVRMRRELVGWELDLAIIKLRRALIKRKYRPDQPRVPAGQPGAGEWTDEGGQGRLSPRLPASETGRQRKTLGGLPLPVALTQRITDSQSSNSYRVIAVDQLGPSYQVNSRI